MRYLTRLLPSRRFFVVFLGLPLVWAGQGRADITIDPAITNYRAMEDIGSLPPGATGTVTLDPLTPMHLIVPDAASDFMKTFMADSTEYPGWTAIPGASLNGTIKINDYLARDYTAHPGFGLSTPRAGADMSATYTPAAGEPELRWIQMYTDNEPQGHVMVTTMHIDPFPNDDGDEKEPFYYTRAEEHSTLEDHPSAPIPTVPYTFSSRFDTYLASFDYATKVATIRDGFEWGYQIQVNLVPEPGSLVLILIGGSGVLLHAVRVRCRSSRD